MVEHLENEGGRGGGRGKEETCCCQVFWDLTELAECVCVCVCVWKVSCCGNNPLSTSQNVSFHLHTHAPQLPILMYEGQNIPSNHSFIFHTALPNLKQAAFRPFSHSKAGYRFESLRLERESAAAQQGSCCSASTQASPAELFWR